MKNEFSFLEDVTKRYSLDSDFKEEYKQYLKDMGLENDRQELLTYLSEYYYLSDYIEEEESYGFNIDMDKFNKWLND